MLLPLFCLVLAIPTQAVTFKIATLSPEGSSWMKLLRHHAKAIGDQTGGEVKFKFYPGGVMGDDKAVMRKMRVGQLHGAVITSGGLAQHYGDIAVYNMPMMFRDETEVDHVRKTMDDVLMAGLRQKKFVGFGFAEVGFAYPMSQVAASAILEVRKRKVWVPDNDPASLRAFEAFKIAPIPLPIADVLAGLQTGLIDSIASPPIGAIALQWYTQIEHVIDLPLMYVYGLFAIGERPFNRLSPEHQKIVERELRAAVAAADGSARRDHESAKTALTNQGINWITPSAAELQDWNSLASAARQRVVDAGLVTADVYNEIELLLTDFRAGAR
ncbi:MAG: TRAP transporter substrate-binding protein DctP [Pseudomonadales bacterium]|nr:TRAP transporter substrate-binding protein DctP [Pseudomonadales bacterium]